MNQPKFAQGPADLLSPAELAEMSGFEFIVGIAEGRLPSPPIAQTLDFRLSEAEVGRVVFVGQPRFTAMNPLGTIHGGWFGTILDSCMACSVQTTLPKGRSYTTLEYKINILRAIRPGDQAFRAIGITTHSGRRTAVATGELRGVDDGKIYATGSTTCLVMDLSSSAT